MVIYPIVFLLLSFSIENFSMISSAYPAHKDVVVKDIAFTIKIVFASLIIYEEVQLLSDKFYV